MRIRVDEAGDFSYRDKTRLWISVIAGIVIPDERWAGVQTFVSDRKDRWDVSELKALDMDDSQLMEVAEFVITEDLTVAAIATDSRIFTTGSQGEWRKRQVADFRAAADRSRRAVEDKQTAERVERLRRRMHQERHIKQPNYLQYGILMPWLLSHLISASLLAYRAMPPGDDGWVMDIVLDARPGADPGKPGELLRDSIEAILAGDDRTALRIPGEWPPDHPFKVKNNDPEIDAISARQVLARGIKRGSSEDDSGLQLADFVAHLVLTLLRDPEDQGALQAWTALVRAPRVMPTEDGWPIKVWAWPADEVAEEDRLRYERLLPSKPPTDRE
jgi:hypothetical protein